MSERYIHMGRIGFWIAFPFLLLFLLAEDLYADAAANNFGLKVGYHAFDNGKVGEGEPGFSVRGEDFDGISFEAEYVRRFVDFFSLTLSAGWYGGESRYSTAEAGINKTARYRIGVTSVLLTPKFHLLLESFDLYTGAGLGIYFLDTDFRTEVDGEEGPKTRHESDTRNKLGYHAMIGAEWLLARHWGLLLEDRYAFAIFKGGSRNTGMGDIDAGGNNVLLGARFRF